MLLCKLYYDIYIWLSINAFVNIPIEDSDKDGMRQVSYEAGLELVNKLDLQFFEICAKESSDFKEL